MKKIIALALALLTVTLFAACNKSETNPSTDGTTAAPAPAEVVLDCEKSVDELLALGSFDDEMMKSDGEYINTRIGTGDAAESSASYIAGSGATAEMLVIFTCADETKCNDVVKLCGDFVETQKSDFSTYNPDEVPKLEAAVIVTHGKYVLFCVAKDASQIKTAFDGYFAK